MFVYSYFLILSKLQFRDIFVVHLFSGKRMISRFISDKRNIFFSRFAFSQIKVVYLHRNNHLPT